MHSSSLQAQSKLKRSDSTTTVFARAGRWFDNCKVDEPRPKRSVLIIGGGMSGMTTARLLTELTNLEVTVLEGNKERYGGRMWSYTVPGYPDRPVDLGAQWLVGGTHPNHPTRLLCQAFGIPTIEHNSRNPKTTSAFDFAGKQLPDDALVDMSQLEKTLAKVKSDMVSQNEKDLSLREVLDKLEKVQPMFMKKDTVKYLAAPWVESDNGTTADQISWKYNDGLITNPSYVGYHSVDALIPSGYKTLLDKIVNVGRRPFRIELDRLVDEIRIDASKNCLLVNTRTSQGHCLTYKADHVVVAVSLGVLKSGTIGFVPDLPEEQKRAIERIGFGNMVKVVLVYDRVFWPKESEMFFAETKNPIGLPIRFLNMHKINGLPALVATIGSEGVLAAEKMADEEILKCTIEKLKDILSEKAVEGAKLVHTKVTRWREDPLIRGTYSFGKIGMQEEDMYNIRKSIVPYLFFAGEHTSYPETEPGTVLAALLSGRRVASEIVRWNGIESSEAKTKTATSRCQMRQRSSSCCRRKYRGFGNGLKTSCSIFI